MNHENLESPATTEQELAERYVAMAYDKQESMEEVLKGTAWNIDLAAGTISFGQERVFPMQVLGSFNKLANTWLWAWENTKSPIPEAMMQQARQLRAYGEQHGLQLFTVGRYDATVRDTLFLGSIALGMFGSSAYYLTDYGNGMLLLTMESEEIDQLPKIDLDRIVRIFTQVTTSYEVRPRPALLHYLAQKGYAAVETANNITAEVDAGTIVAAFSNQGSLTELRARTR